MTDQPRPGLGRRARFDPRDLHHPMRAALAAPAPPPRPSPWGFRWAPLDQGRAGTCVGHTGKELLLASPFPQGSPTAPPTALELNDLSCALDEWPENDHDPERQWGTSGNGLMKALRQLGFVSTWVNADPDDPAPEMNAWLALHGPVCVGIDWPENWFATDDQGLVPAPSAHAAGGHEFLVRWYDAAHDLYLIQQSWGRGVGRLLRSGQRDGLMRVPAPWLLERIRDGGDAKAPMEQSVT